MIKTLIVTHGHLADELVAAARTIDPDLAQDVHPLSLPWDADFDQAREMVVRRLAGLDDGGGVLVLTDMFGGTATNLVLPSLEEGRVEVVTGVNLPMLVKLGSRRDRSQDLHEMARKVVAAGQRSIHVASEFLAVRG